MPEKLPYQTIFFDLGETLVLPVSRQWVPGAPAALSALKNAGVRLGIISNTGDLTRDELKAQFLPADFSFETFHAELVILSREVKEQAKPKPSLEIFSLAIKRAESLFPGVHFFCGENAVETLAAQQVGFRALRLLPPGIGSDIAHLLTTLRAVPVYIFTQ